MLLFLILALFQTVSSQTVECGSPWLDGLFSDQGQRMTFSVAGGNPSSPALIATDGDLSLSADVDAYISPICTTSALKMVQNVLEINRTSPTPDSSFTFATTSWSSTTSFADFQIAADASNGFLLVQRDSLAPGSNSVLMSCCNLTSVASTAGSSAGTEAASSSSASSALSSSSSSISSTDDPDTEISSSVNIALSTQSSFSPKIAMTTEQSFSSSSSASPLITPSDSDSGAIIAVIILLLLVGAATVAIALFLRRRQQKSKSAEPDRITLGTMDMSNSSSGSYTDIASRNTVSTVALSSYSDSPGTVLPPRNQYGRSPGGVGVYASPNNVLSSQYGRPPGAAGQYEQLVISWECTACGNVNSAELLFCMKCGGEKQAPRHTAPRRRSNSGIRRSVGKASHGSSRSRSNSGGGSRRSRPGSTNATK